MASQSGRFCTQCGSQLVEGDRFCGQCGAPAAPAGAAPGPATGPLTGPAAGPVAGPAAGPVTAGLAAGAVGGIAQSAAASRTAPPAQAQTQPQPQPQPQPIDDEPVLGIIPNLARKKSLFSYENFNLVVTPKRLIFALATKEMLQEAAQQAAADAKAEGKGLLGRMLSTMASGFVFHKRYLEMEPEKILRETQGNFSMDPRSIRSIRLFPGDSGENEPDRVVIQSISGKMQFQTKGLNERSARALLSQVVPNTR